MSKSYVLKEMALRFTKSGIAYEVQAHQATTSKPVTETVLAVFVHGNGLCRGVYREMIKEVFNLNKDRKLVTLSLDLGGHGDSSKVAYASRKKVSDFAIDIENCVDDFLSSGENEVDRVVVVGHSIGGAMSMFAQRNRALFDSALFLEPMLMEVADGQPEELIAATKRRKKSWPSKDAAFSQLRPKGIFASWQEQCVRDYVDVGIKTSSNGATADLACSPDLESAIFQLDISEVFPFLPVLGFRKAVVVAGAESTHMPPFYTEEIATKFVPEAEFVLLEKAHHVPMCEQPKIVAQHFMKLLTGESSYVANSGTKSKL